jgi:hypothetical protein
MRWTQGVGLLALMAARPAPRWGGQPVCSSSGTPWIPNGGLPWLG